MPISDDPKYYRAYYFGVFFIGYIGDENDKDRKKGIFYTGNNWFNFTKLDNYKNPIYQVNFYPTELPIEDLEIVSMFNRLGYFNGNFVYHWMLFVNKKARRVWNVGDAQFYHLPVVKNGIEIELPKKAKTCTYFECTIWMPTQTNGGGIIFIFDDEVWAHGIESEAFWIGTTNQQRLQKQFNINHSV